MTSIILEGVWDKLNSDLKLIDFDKVNTEAYFNSIYKKINIGKKNKRLGYLSSLPSWIFNSHVFEYTGDVNRTSKLLQQARDLILANNKKSYLGLLYLSHFSPNLDSDKILFEEYYKTKNTFFEIPSFELMNKSQSPKLIAKDDISGINYVFTETPYNVFALRCYEIIYNKKFASINEYEQFLDYCNGNYLAQWKFLNTLTTEDYKSLINKPRKLLEILTLTEKYYYKNSHNTELFDYGTNNVKPLIDFIELKDTVSSKNPYLSKRFLNYYHHDDELNNKSINALKSIANKLEIEEIFDIINPESIEDYNNTIKTEDFLNYKYLISFIIVSQQEQFLTYPKKDKAFNTLKYYWKNEFISWPFRYLITDLLIQIDSIKALNMFKNIFEINSNEGSFMRQAVLSSIIYYDFEKNSKFIEEWYWTIQNKDFDHRPKEHEYILKLLEEKDKNTIELYNKITTDIRYKE